MPESLNFNGNIFFELSLAELDEKMASASYRKTKKKSGTEQQNKEIILHRLAVDMKTKTKANSG